MRFSWVCGFSLVSPESLIWVTRGLLSDKIQNNFKLQEISDNLQDSNYAHKSTSTKSKVSLFNWLVSCCGFTIGGRIVSFTITKHSHNLNKVCEATENHRLITSPLSTAHRTTLWHGVGSSIPNVNTCLTLRHLVTITGGVTGMEWQIWRWEPFAAQLAEWCLLTELVS